MSLFLKIGIFIIFIFVILLFNQITFRSLVEGHGGGGHMGFTRAGRSIGYGAAGYGLYYGGYGGGDNDYGYYDYYPPVYGEYSYDVYGNPIVYYV